MVSQDLALATAPIFDSHNEDGLAQFFAKKWLGTLAAQLIPLSEYRVVDNEKNREDKSTT